MGRYTTKRETNAGFKFLNFIGKLLMYENSLALYKDNPFPGKLTKYLDTIGSPISRVFLSIAKVTLFGKHNVRRLRNYYLKGLEYEPKLIVDVGCGTGETTHIIGKAFPNAKVVGIDLSNTSIDYANMLNQYLKMDNVSFINRDITVSDDLNAINGADVIIMSGSLHHFDEPKKILKFLSSKIQSGGFIEISVYGRMFEGEKNIKTILQSMDYIKTKEQAMSVIKSFDLDRLNSVLNMKRENRLLKSVKAILSRDFSYFGYVLFPHNVLATNLDGYANPVVHYYNPETLMDLIAAADHRNIEHVLPPTRYDKNPYYEKMNNHQKFLLCDAKSWISMYTVKIWI